MKPVFPIFALLAALAGQQAVAAESYQLLFARNAGQLSRADMRSIASALGFSVTADGKHLEDRDGCGTIRFDTQVVDLNKDGTPEVIISAGNTCLSGNAGASLYLFIKDRTGQYREQLGVPAVGATPLASGNAGFPDLLIQGPGFCTPVWRWNGEKYDLLCSREESAGACAGLDGSKPCTKRQLRP